jgi:hypothetical protein
MLAEGKNIDGSIVSTNGWICVWESEKRLSVDEGVNVEDNRETKSGVLARGSEREELRLERAFGEGEPGSAAITRRSWACYSCSCR